MSQCHSWPGWRRMWWRSDAPRGYLQRGDGTDWRWSVVHDIEAWGLGLPDRTVGGRELSQIRIAPPPPPARAKLKFQNLTETTPSVALTRALFVCAMKDVSADNCIMNVPSPPHVHPPPRDDGSPPPRGEPSPNDAPPPPPPGGGTVHHSRPANSSITQPKIFFSAFGACDFLLISYCSWAK